ncbi:hypothetical protein [Caulobacter mirabilis]|uniref:Transporter n=1 Tax=Caulobacter mirabilis TaxID=69666 RepID=A0A2D2B3Y4_9CAUL|nr:hypothetical protein [Caulobacter mirabilis]ATQ44980.1 hypothetical protein CSW64_11380 [Caulobacter mirabilis]
MTLLVCTALTATPALAADPAVEARLQRLEALAEAQARQIADQQTQLRIQSDQLAAQNAELARLREPQLADMAGRGALLAPDQAMSTAPREYAQVTPPPSPATPPQPVGAPPPPSRPVEVAAIPERSGVLTPKGQLIFEPSLDYTHASTNRLVFRGIEIVTGIQIGVIEASDADRNAVGASISARYGLTDRLELQSTIPWVVRSDRVTTLAQRDETITRTIDLDGKGVGDVEFAARYQINRAKPGQPIWIAGLRVKSDSGTSPFEIDRDEFGIAKKLATGSGFWAVEPSVSFLFPTDPIVIFGGLSYLYHAPKDIDQVIGDVRIGEVDPGDSIGANLGFGFAVNPRFSFSLGYKHNYIFPTKSEVGDTKQKSESLQVGSFTFGWSYRLNDRLTLTNSFEFGATADAPDVRVVFRLPYRF